MATERRVDDPLHREVADEGDGADCVVRDERRLEVDAGPEHVRDAVAGEAAEPDLSGFGHHRWQAAQEIGKPGITDREALPAPDAGAVAGVRADVVPVPDEDVGDLGEAQRHHREVHARKPEGDRADRDRHEERKHRAEDEKQHEWIPRREAGDLAGARQDDEVGADAEEHRVAER